MVEFLFGILPTIVGGLLLAAATWLLRKIVRLLNDFRHEHADLLKVKKEHDVLLESQRNQLKADIVRIYEAAKERGIITYMELDTLNRLADSYFALGGNHYIHSVVKKANAMPVGGEEIPT